MLSQRQGQNHSCLRMAFICDFDGTITRTDVCDEIMSAFGDSVWNEIGLDYSCGKISHRDMNMHFASLLKMNNDKLKSFLNKRITIKNGFGRFIEWCTSRQVLFVVVSGGWFSYIRHLLAENGAILIDDPADLLSGWQGKIPVISNDIEFQPTSRS